jgi:hypothetical protein
LKTAGPPANRAPPSLQEAHGSCGFHTPGAFPPAGTSIVKVIKDPDKPTEVTFQFSDGTNKTVYLGGLEAKARGVARALVLHQTVC